MNKGLPWTIAVEKKTVKAMVSIYCRTHHASRGGFCPSCEELLHYSHQRLDRCLYGTEKPTCRECPVHCYRPVAREKMMQVMRFAGPKMVLRHPFLALIHLWKEHSPWRIRPRRTQTQGKNRVPSPTKDPDRA